MASTLARFLFGISMAALGTGLGRAQAPDLATAERELAAVFERPAGTPLGAPQQQKLAEWLQRYEGKDLGPLGYGKALDFYIRRDAVGGAAALDEFFAHHDRIANAEHATMAGRIYLVAMREESRKQDHDQTRVHRWAERSAALFPDLTMVARQAVLISGSIADASGFRQALVRGMHRTAADDATKDRFLAILYAPLSDGGASAAGSGRDVVAPTQPLFPSSPMVDTGGTKPGPGGANDGGSAGSPDVGKAPKPTAAPGVGSVGTPLPHLVIEHALHTEPGLQLADLRGKVVVLDFFASWSSASLTLMSTRNELQTRHGRALHLLGVTTFCGFGTDFPIGAKTPSDGISVVGLDRNREIALYENLSRALSIDRPILFTTEQCLRKTFDIAELPTSIVVGKDGRIVGRVSGSGRDEQRLLAELVAQAMR